MFEISFDAYKAPYEKIPLGHQGENEARCLVWDLTDYIESFGTGSVQVKVTQPKTKQVYLAEHVTMVGNQAKWTLTNVDTAQAGTGLVELYYYGPNGGDVLAKSHVMRFWMLPTQGAPGDAPSPYEDFIDDVAAYAAAAMAAAQVAIDAAASFNVDTALSTTSDMPVRNSAITTAINALNGRVDALVVEATPTEDTELIDIRTGYDGTIYQSAGTAVREQITDAHDEFTYEINESNINTQRALNTKVDGGYVEDGVAYFTGNGVELFSITGIGGGGGGGGGGGNNAKLTLTNTSGWLSKTISEGTDCVVTAVWSSLEDDIPTGNGTLTIKVNGAVKAVRDIPQGNISINAKDYLSPGTNFFVVSVTDAYGNNRGINYTISVVSLNLRSSFDASTPKEGSFIYSYIPTGNVDKTVYFIVDGTAIGTAEVTVSGRQQSYTIPAQTHGAHSLRVYFEAEINGETVRSNELVYDVICIVSGTTTPIIASTFSQTTAEQFTTLTIPYTVYNPQSLTSSVTLKANGTVVNTVTVDRTQQTWNYRADTVGNLALEIKVGSVTRAFYLTISESSIDVSIETRDLVLSLSSEGRSNSEAHPEVWEDEHTSCTLTGFNFASDGWQIDESGSVVLRVSGNARVAIPYKPFTSNFLTTGKTIEIDFATRDVLNYDAVILSCMNGNRGMEITANNARLASEQSAISAQYKENEHIRITFVIEKQGETSNRLMYTYINGIMSGVLQYPNADDFSQAEPQNISIGSNLCTMDIYAIRIYNNDLTREQVLENWIADTQDINTMLERYNHNNVLDAYGNIVISKLPSDLPYMILTGTKLPQYKGDKQTVSVEYVDPVSATKSFTADGVQIDVQGTSSQYYARKNYKMKYKNGFVIGGETASKYN